MSILTTLAVVAFMHSAPATQTCTAPTQTGTFRITAIAPDSASAKLGMIVFEDIDGCLEATILTEEAGPAIIDHLSVSGDDVTGTLRTARGNAKVTLRIATSSISGSIMDGTREWRVSGKRTSGTQRVADR